jgi:hypothetical protein
MMYVNTTFVHAAGTTPSDAAVVGQAAPGIIECGTGYTSHELYDTKITVLEMSRGENAWSSLSKLDRGNRPPPAGYDYILARIKFEYNARGRPGDCVHTVNRKNFTALSSDGLTYPNPELSVPEPALSGPLKSGESITGWIAFQVAHEDTTPLMTFSIDEDGAVQHGGKLWFKLY